MTTPRQRYVGWATASYLVLALAWILLSDRLLTISSDAAAMVWLSTVKGVLFVLVTTAVLFVALRSVPAAGDAGPGAVLDALAQGVAKGKLRRWIAYAFAVAVTLATLLVRDGIAAGFGEGPMMILFMLPITVSAMLGGFGPGFVATAVAAIGIDYFALAPARSFHVMSDRDLLRWAMLILAGITVSLLCELLRRALAKAESHRRLLDAIVAGTTDAVFVKDAAGRYVLVNAATATIVGKRPDEIIGHDDTAIFPPASAQEVIAIDRAIMASGRTQTHEEHIVTLAGAALDFLVSKGPIHDAAGRAVGLFGISRDITSRKFAENAQRSSEERLQLLIEHAPAALAMFDRQMRYLAASRRWLDDYHLGGTDVVGRSHYDVFPEIPEAWRDVHRRALAGEAVRDDESAFDRADGTRQWLRWEVRPWRTADGAVGGIVIFSEDISARKEAAARLAASEAALAAAQRLAGVGNWSWDLRCDRHGWSAEVYRIYGRDPALPPAVYPEVESYFAADSWSRLAAAVDRCVAEGIGYELDAEVIRPDGARRWIIARGERVRDADGGIDGLRGTVQDITDRKRAEAEVLATRNQLRATLDALPDLLFETELDGRIHDYHSPRSDLLAVPPEDFLGKRFADLLPAEVVAVTQAALVEAAEQGTSTGRSYALTLPQGRRWFELSVAPKAGADGAPRRFIVLARDITERMNAEADLRASKAKLEAALASMSDAVFVSDAEGRFIDFNDAFATFHKFADKDQCAKTLAEFPAFLEVRSMAGELLPLEQWAVPRALRGEAATNAEFILRRTDTDEAWVGNYSYAPIRDQAGAVVGSVVTARDITERRRSAEELEQHRNHLEELVTMRTREVAAVNQALAQRAAEFVDLYDRAPCGYHSLAPDGTILAANATELALLGYARDEYVGQRITGFMTPASRALFESQLAELRRVGRARDLDYDFVRKDGSILPVLVNADLVPGTDGEPGYNRATMVDNSERKARETQIAAMQAELARRTDAAEAATRAKSAFLANMSHEIRTPMNGILGMAHLVRRSGVTAEQAERLDKIDASGRHLIGIINDILDLAKIEAGRVVLAQEDFTLHELLHGITAVIGDGIGAKGLTLNIDIAGMPHALRGDVIRLRQALMNYLGNALKFTEKGSITLRGRLLAEDADGYRLRFEVVDTGVGIPEDVVPRLFASFEQADNSTTRAHGGTGLGLAITRRIAGMMGGETGVGSTPGRGSTFWLTVRLGRGKAAPAVAGATHDENAEARLLRDHRGARVLLAEDEPINQQVTLEFLRDVGLTADLADNGADAVRMATGTDYALILMDMQMPVQDGLAATRAIRALPGRSGTPIVALTANAFDDDRRACLAAGMNDFIPKPVDPELLFATLVRWLDRR